MTDNTLNSNDKMVVTIQDIAEEVGVSRGTVDRVLNHRGRVSKETEQRVLEVARRLGYQKSMAGTALAARRKKLQLGFIYIDSPALLSTDRSMKQPSEKEESWLSTV